MYDMFLAFLAVLGSYSSEFQSCRYSQYTYFVSFGYLW